MAQHKRFLTVPLDQCVTYLRTLFVQGSRSVLLATKSWPRHVFGRWLAATAPRLHRNVLAIALANKLARIARGVLHNQRGYDANFERCAG